MSSVEAIEKAVEGLDKKELASFRDWFDEYDSSKFDEQIESDAQKGKLDDLISQAKKDFSAGKATQL